MEKPKGGGEWNIPKWTSNIREPRNDESIDGLDTGGVQLARTLSPAPPTRLVQGGVLLRREREHGVGRSTGFFLSRVWSSSHGVTAERRGNRRVKKKKGMLPRSFHPPSFLKWEPPSPLASPFVSPSWPLELIAASRKRRAMGQIGTP